MQSVRVWIASLLLIVGTICIADTSATDATDFSSFDKTLLPIDSKAPDNNIKVMDYLSVWKGILPKKWAIFKIQSALYKLKFYPDIPTGEENPEYTKAIKDFQKSIGANPTGELLVGQWVELVKRVNKLYPTHFYPREIYPESLEVAAEPTYFSAVGTWLSQGGDSDKYPFLQSSEIRCFKQASTCVEANAMIIENPNQGKIIRDYLVAGSTIWKISSWTDQEIVAENKSFNCVNATIYINVVSQKVYRLFRYYPGPGCSATQNREPHIYDLVDGKTYAKGFYTKQKQQSENFYNPIYLDKIAHLKKEK